MSTKHHKAVMGPKWYAEQDETDHQTPRYCACDGVWGMGDKCAKCGLPRTPITPSEGTS